MKPYSKIKLTQLGKRELEDRQMKVLRGGCMPSSCGCMSYGEGHYGSFWLGNYDNQSTGEW